MEGYKWVEISEKIANKILEYKNKDTELMNIIQETKIKMGKKEENKNGNTILNIDGLSAINIIFTRAKNANQRDEFIRKIQIKTHMKEESPNGEYKGIPNLFFQQVRLTNGLEIENELRKNLWELFEAGLIYADNKSENSKINFINKYNKVFEVQKKLDNKISTHFIKKITVALFLSRPSTYVPLDNYTLNEIKEMPIFKENIIESCKQAEKYLELIEEAEKYITNNSTLKYKTIYELSYYAYQREETAYKDIIDNEWYSGGFDCTGRKEKRKDIDMFFEKGIFAIGWGDEVKNLKNYRNKEEIKESINSMNDPHKIDCKMAIDNLMNLRKGDIIVLKTSPVHYTKIYAIGKVCESFEKEKGYKFIDGLHMIPVKWIKKFDNPVTCLDIYLNYTFKKLKGNEKEIILKLLDEEGDIDRDIIEYDEESSIKQNTAENIIYYGVPGCGKSYLVKKNVENNFDNYERVLFHPEYAYTDFVGQILPIVDESKENKTIKYEFSAGPFTRILAKALKDETKSYCLVIEEINRGNAEAIFGDIFQLMDRRKKDEYDTPDYGYKKGDSEYAITNRNIYEYLRKENIDTSKLIDGEKIYIPNNLSIYATMNTSDQNVFMLDTAFKRRWKLRYVPIDFSNNDRLFDTYIPLPEGNTKIKWSDFVKILNKWIPKLNNGINGEDKLIGQYFVSEEELENIEDFAQKILLYLWNDVTKIDRYVIFNKYVETYEINTLEDVIEAYKRYGLQIFINDIFSNESDIQNEDKEE